MGLQMTHMMRHPEAEMARWQMDLVMTDSKHGTVHKTKVT